MKYRHVRHAKKLVEQLYRQEAGIMRAEKAVNGVSRDIVKMFREYSKEKARLDRGQEISNMKKAAREEGLAIGRAEGHTEGRAEGRTEGKLDIARKMKNAGRPLSEISEFTGLEIQAIEEIVI